MKKLSIFFGAFALALSFISSIKINAQNRKSVSTARVNGTFRDYFCGKFKGNYNEIKILALGKGKIRISFGLTYPYMAGTHGMMANTGEAEGKAIIEGDTAVYTSEE